MRKRLLMLLTLAFLLVACGNQQETNTPSTDQTTSTESTTTTEPTSTTEAPTTTEEPTEPPHEHAYTEAITTDATCEADGVKTFTCDCGDTYTEAIEATGHNYGDYVYNNDATYEADGTETATCSTCGDKTTRTKAGTKLEPETHWYDGYAKHVWHDMGEYMFWIGDTQEEADNALGPSEELSQALAILKERYPDRSTYLAAHAPDGMPTAFMSTSIGNPGQAGFYRPTFLWSY